MTATPFFFWFCFVILLIILIKISQRIIKQSHTQLTNVTVLSLPAGLTDAGPVVALAVLFTAGMACSLVARGANPTVLALAQALRANTVAATWHRAQLCRNRWVGKHVRIKNKKKRLSVREEKENEGAVSHWIQVREKSTCDRRG